MKTTIKRPTYNDVVEYLLLGVHLGVVEGLGQRLFAAEARGDCGDACAYGKHFGENCGIFLGGFWGERGLGGL